MGFGPDLEGPEAQNRLGGAPILLGRGTQSLSTIDRPNRLILS
jgi:hypothetical protein